MGEAKRKANMAERLQRRFAIQRQGAEARDAHMKGSPYDPTSHESVDFRTGYLIRDLMLKLCLADDAFKAQLLASGQVTEGQLAFEEARRATVQ